MICGASLDTLTMAPAYGPPLPPLFNLMRRRRSHRHWIVGLVLARVLLYLLEEEIQNEDSHIHGLIRSYFCGHYIYMDRQSAFLDVELRIIYQMSRRSMDHIHHDLYPFLRPHLTDAQIEEARAEGNRRRLSVDEKLGIGLMTAGGCTLGRILQGFNTGKTCAFETIQHLFDAGSNSKSNLCHTFSRNTSGVTSCC